MCGELPRTSPPQLLGPCSESAPATSPLGQIASGWPQPEREPVRRAHCGHVGIVCKWQSSLDEDGDPELVYFCEFNPFGELMMPAAPWRIHLQQNAVTETRSGQEAAEQSELAIGPSLDDDDMLGSPSVEAPPSGKRCFHTVLPHCASVGDQPRRQG